MKNKSQKLVITFGIIILLLGLSVNPSIGKLNNDDTTPPESDFPPVFDPIYPDGENGWFVSNVTVFLNASDDLSGVKEIRYTINDGPVQVIPGSNGSFILFEEGDDILVEYWAVDNAGNVETPKNSFTIDIDKTPPYVKLTYDIVDGNRWQGWELSFTVIAYDNISGICGGIEFYFNNELQETVEGSGPEYVWTLRYWPIPNPIFRATVCNCAGLCASDEVIPKTSIRNVQYKLLFERYLIFQYIYFLLDLYF